MIILDPVVTLDEGYFTKALRIAQGSFELEDFRMKVLGYGFIYLFVRTFLVS